MTQLQDSNRRKLDYNQGKQDEILLVSSATTCDVSHQEQETEVKHSTVAPERDMYLFNDGNYFPEDTKFPLRVQSSHSLLGLVGLEGHEESEEDFSTAGISAVTEEQEVMDIPISPSTPVSPSEGQAIEDASCNTTPPGSVQGRGILSLSPPRLTTYSAGSVTSASVTENFVRQPRPIQSIQRQNHLPQESPRFSRSPLVQQPQLQSQPQPRSRPPRAPHPPTTIPGGNNSVGGAPILMPRAVIGTGSESISLSGAVASSGGHSRTSTDATNYSFLSSLTDVSGGEYSAPRRRTLSWDNNGNSKKGGTATESKSLGGSFAPGSILQPILLPEELDSTARPPTSISASNLRKSLPLMPRSAATTPTRPSSLRNTSSTTFLAPSLLPSRENLHPLIQQLQNVPHAKSSTFLPRSSENSPHPLVQKVQDSSLSKHGHTTSAFATSPFAIHLQDEKKDDESSRSRRMAQQKPLSDRKRSDSSSFPSSFASSTTVRLQKKKIASPENFRGAFERHTPSPQRINESGAMIDPKYIGKTRFDLGDILDATRECNIQTDIIEDIERNNLINIGNENCNDDVSSSMYCWPYLLLIRGILSLGWRGLNYDSGSEVRSIFACDKFIQFCLGLGAAAIMKRKLSKKFVNGQILRLYWAELLQLRQIWTVLNEIVAVSKKEEKDNSDAASKRILSSRDVLQLIDRIISWNTCSSSVGLGMTREDFIDSAHTAYERLVKQDDEEVLSFGSLCQAADLFDTSIDRSKIKILSELFCPSRKGQISKFDFVKSIDSLFKTTTLLVANVNNVSQICIAIDHIVNAIFYTIVLILSPSIFGADINTLLLTLLVIFIFMICITRAETLKGILHIITQKSYDIGDRVYFINPEDTEIKIGNGPPSGGWIVEKIDLYKTTFRQGLTGERIIFANGSALLTNSRVVNWKRSHRANVTFSIEFSSFIARIQVQFFRRQISEWIEDRPREWIHLDSFRMVDVDIHRQRVRYEFGLRHRESWHNYTAVRDSKSDILVFLHELRNSVEA